MCPRLLSALRRQRPLMSCGQVRYICHGSKSQRWVNYDHSGALQGIRSSTELCLDRIIRYGSGGGRLVFMSIEFWFDSVPELVQYHNRWINKTFYCDRRTGAEEKEVTLLGSSIATINSPRAGVGFMAKEGDSATAKTGLVTGWKISQVYN